MEFPNWILQRAHVSPDRTALSCGEEKWTFRELADEALDMAGKLRTAGLEEGTRVGLLLESGPEAVFLIHGALLAGLELVMLNSRLTEAELDYQVRDSEAACVIASDRLLEKAGPEALSAGRLAASEGATLDPAAVWPEDRTMTIMYTSGTTGFPKGVRQTAGNHFSSAVASVLNMGLSDDDVWLCAMPLFHISGFSILMRSLLYGMEVRLQTKFDEEAAAREIAEGTVTRISVVSATLARLLNRLEESGLRASGNFRTMLAGGGPVPVPYIRRAQALGIPILQTYGMTETSSQTATLSAEEAVRKAGSSGKPLFLNRIRIEGAEAPGEEGEILVSGPHVTPGYVGKFSDHPAQTDGWLHTGDIGRIDEEGFLYVLDRRSDLIVSGGENVYPAEVEQALVSHPSVLEAGVTGMPDDRWGEVPAAFIVVRTEVGEEELRDFCAERLASYKVPKAIIFTDDLPRNASNKLLRRELKKRLGNRN
ncbi:o-succinylbenzoate--CoA ligase [Edaphobacillus lindanitolerans]|uniref:2-succinylbenzoate--CoA ligase n=1 Tax=Edaphobacillus lindanitolerans TaxID=550447 RepID=A0A1U7PKQ8_9BACI|nr:o-succinylbenzoate--CoA ligase [Edaphobacillus lindanitolerans]SIT85795.1 2-succinylbenzoyl-CoA synthetase [Edaphobacillus lindanitolerans]